MAVPEVQGRAFTVTPLPGSAFGGPSITLSAKEIRPKTAVPIALTTGGT